MFYIVVILSIVLIISWKLSSKHSIWYNNELNRYKSFYQLESLWRKKENEGRSIRSFLIEHDVNTVAIYGMGKYGKLLYETLKREGIETKYAIDKKSIPPNNEILILSPESELPEVDLVIVTVSYEYNSIAQGIRKKLDCPIVSVEQILQG